MKKLSEAAARTIAKALVDRHKDSVKEVANCAQLATSPFTNRPHVSELKTWADERLKETVAAIKEFGDISLPWLKKWMEDEIANNEKQAAHKNRETT